jgi:transcriptional regulator with XRE-family HTH domain
MGSKNFIQFYREKAGYTQATLANLIGVSIKTVSRYESGLREPRTSEFQRLCSALGTTEAALLNGPSAKEMIVRILIKESLDEMEVIDLSKDAPYMENVTLTPNKSSVLVVFDDDKTIDDAIEAIREKKEKIERARADLFGTKDNAA